MESMSFDLRAANIILFTFIEFGSSHKSQDQMPQDLNTHTTILMARNHKRYVRDRV